MSGLKRVQRLSTQNVVFFECDVQERMRTIIKNFDSVLHNSVRVTKLSKIFKIPVISTNQVPKVFGPTVKELTDLHQGEENVFAYSKADFSMLEKPVLDHFVSLKRD